MVSDPPPPVQVRVGVKQVKTVSMITCFQCDWLSSVEKKRYWIKRYEHTNKTLLDDKHEMFKLNSAMV